MCGDVMSEGVKSVWGDGGRGGREGDPQPSGVLVKKTLYKEKGKDTHNYVLIIYF